MATYMWGGVDASTGYGESYPNAGAIADPDAGRAERICRSGSRASVIRGDRGHLGNSSTIVIVIAINPGIRVDSVPLESRCTVRREPGRRVVPRMGTSDRKRSVYEDEFSNSDSCSRFGEDCESAAPSLLI